MPQIDLEKLEAYAWQIFERENQFNTFTLETIGRRIKATGQLSAFDQEALKNIADISGDMDKITKKLAQITEMNIADVEKIYAQVVNDSINTYKPLYDFKNMTLLPINQNDYAMKLVRHWAELTAEEMINLSHTKAIGFTDRYGNFTDIQGAFQRTVDDAVVAVSTGTTDFNSAMARTIEQLGGSGVVTNYGSGVTRSLGAMIRQNLLWGAKEAAQSYDDYVSEELGLDGFEVDAHSGCRPTHEFMQGQIYSYNGRKKVNGIVYEDGAEALARLEDYGCLHFKTGVLLGVSESRYSKEELDRIHKETTEKIEYNGREKTLYEWKQTQRRLERAHRTAQNQEDVFKASGNNIAAKDYRNKANAIRSTYDDLTNSIPGLYDHSERMRTYFEFGSINTEQNFKSVIRDDRNPLVFFRQNKTIKSTRLLNTSNELYVSDNVKLKPLQQHIIDKNITRAKKVMNITSHENLPKIVIVDSSEMSSHAIASYNAADNILRVVSDLGKKKKISILQKDGVYPNNQLSTYVHELIHWQNAEKYKDLYGDITKNNYKQYIEWSNTKAKKELDKIQKSGYNINGISKYSDTMLSVQKFDEVYTEYKTKIILAGEK